METSIGAKLPVDARLTQLNFATARAESNQIPRLNDRRKRNGQLQS